MNGAWVEPDKRDQVVDFVGHWAKRTRRPIEEILAAADIAVGKFYDWRKRYGDKNQHNGKVPRDFWLRDWERQKILDFQTLYPDAGYRRLTYMLLDADSVAVSPASVWRDRKSVV